jgi:chromosome segregation ATPase
MRKATPFLALVLSGVCLAGVAHAAKPAKPASTSKSSSQAGSQTYKWVDENGVTHYGDSVPAEYSQREQHVLNSQGIEVQKRQAEMTPAEAAAFKAKQKEESDRRQHDMFLMSTYPSVKEIETVRDARLDQINGQISASEAYIASLTTRVDGLKQRAQGYAPYNTSPGARRMPDDLAEEMVRALSELRTQNAALAQRRAELQNVVDQFDGDIRRFKELRTSAEARLNEASRNKK